MTEFLTTDEFFDGRAESKRLFEHLRTMIETIGPSDVRVSKSQVAFRRRTGFAFVWMPETYLGPGQAPLVLTVGLRRRDPSPRWKESIEAAPGRFTHHLEIRDECEVDDEVREWLREAWEDAA